jgi:hypothetical protein
LSNVATLHRDSVPTNLNQTNVQPVFDIYERAGDMSRSVVPAPRAWADRIPRSLLPERRNGAYLARNWKFESISLRDNKEYC